MYEPFQEFNEDNPNAGESGRKDAVTHPSSPVATQIDRVFTDFASTSNKRRSKPLKPTRDDGKYIHMLAAFKINRAFCYTFKWVTRNTFSKFRKSPLSYITIPDMMKVESFTGISVGRQFDILTHGLTIDELYFDKHTGSTQHSDPFDKVYDK